MKITRSEILKGQPCPPEYEENLVKLLTALNTFRNVYDAPMIVTSGYRTVEHNRSVGGRPTSAHLTCQAADFEDKDHSIQHFCLENLKLLEALGLYMEDPAWTLGWTHLQTKVIPSGHRVFIP